MTVATPPAGEMDTLEDLLKRLGDVPPGRVRLHPPPGTATEEDVIEAEARTGRLCELVDGTLVEKAMGYYESRLAVVLGAFLEVFLEGHDLGIVLGADALVRMQPRQVLLPDLSFFSWDQFPDRVLPRQAILVLPGFVLPVRRWFERAGERAEP